MKIGVKEEPLGKKHSPNTTTTAAITTTTASNTPTGLVTPASRTRSASRGSGGASPRGPHKPSSVAPAPPRPNSRPGSLNRFGFRSGGRVKAGDSTDSVNSILSDAQTATDSTPDLCDLCDLENGNTTTVTTNTVTTNSSSRLPSRPDNAGKQTQQTAKQTHQVKQQQQQQQQQQLKPQLSPPKQATDSRHLDSPASRVSRPGSASNGASAGSSPAPPGRITATTRQLPKPQIPTVKSFPNSKIQPQPQVTQVFVDLPGRGKPFHPAPRVSRDSESSSKSTTEADSGLGSSSESDRIARGEETGDTDTLDSTNLEFPEDVSELWLREKRGSVLEAGRGGASHLAPHSTLELAFRGSGSIEVKRRGLEVKVTANPTPSTMPSKGVSGMTASSPPSVLSSPPERKGKGGKEKRESPITYGMARQKFAPYSRNRFGYYHSTYQTRNTATTDAATTAATAKLSIATPTTTTTTTNKVYNGSSTNTKITPPPPKTSPVSTKSHTRSPPSQHHTSTKTSPPPPHSNRSPPNHHTTAKTSPPHTTTGLVKSRVALLETTPHANTKKPSPQPPPSLRKPGIKKPLVRPTSLEKSPSLVMPVSERNIELSKPVFRRLEYSEYSEGQKDATGTQNKGVVEDILIVGSVETETVADNTYDLKMTSRQHAEKSIERSLKTSPSGDLPPNEVTKASQDAKEREKVLLETSMEASLSSMTSDLSLTPHNLSPDGSKILTPQSESSFEILESLSETLDLTIEEAKKVEEQDEPTSTSSTASTSSLPTAVPPTHSTPTQAHRAASAHTHTHTHTTTTTTSPTTDHRKPLSQLLSSLKSSLDSRSSLESSGDSQRSPTEPAIPGAHHHPPPALTNSSSGPSGTCTPVLTSARDLDLDFLIDDEIADQPGLTFGDEAGGAGLSTSFFGDDEFDELVAAVAGGGAASGAGGAVSSPTHHHHHSLLLPHHHGSPGGSGAGSVSAAAAEGCRRPRTDSLDTTTSSLAGDDLMLDYEASTPSDCSTTTTTTTNTSTSTTTTAGVREGARPKQTHLRIALPGRRYDEEVMSPDASEIFSEWTAMMAELGSNERCASRDGSCGSGRVPRPRQGSLTDPVVPPDPRRPMVLRPPRQGSVSESEGSCGSGGGSGGGLSGSSSSGSSGGGVYVDRTTYHYMYQDVTSLKTMLLRLRRMLQAADTINPFDANLRNSLYLSLASSESPGLNGEKDALTPAQVCQENVDLRRQVVLLQQQLEDKDRTIRLLQQQLSQSLSLHHHHTLHNTTTTTSPAAPYSSSTTTTTTTTAATATTTSTVNAATQTERLARAPLTGSSLSRAASIDDGLGPTVSSEGESSERGRLRSSSIPAHHSLHPQRAASQPPPPLRPRPAPSHR